MDTHPSVTVSADDTGNVIHISENNPEYGYVRIESVLTEINAEGWLRTVKRSALIKGLVKDLVAYGFHKDQTLPGKIVVKESLTPFNPENPERDLKVAGSTGVVCRMDDQPIYRQTFYTQHIEAEDNLIPHTNTEEIRNARKATATPRLDPSKVNIKRDTRKAVTMEELIGL